jgi:hypothetical protein
MKLPQPICTNSEAAAENAVIDANPSGIGVKVGDNERRDNRGEHLADRGEGLLQKHRRKGGQHSGQSKEDPLELDRNIAGWDSDLTNISIHQWIFVPVT